MCSRRWLQRWPVVPLSQLLALWAACVTLQQFKSDYSVCTWEYLAFYLAQVCVRVLATCLQLLTKHDERLHRHACMHAQHVAHASMHAQHVVYLESLAIGTVTCFASCAAPCGRTTACIACATQGIAAQRNRLSIEQMPYVCFCLLLQAIVVVLCSITFVIQSRAYWQAEKKQAQAQPILFDVRLGDTCTANQCLCDILCILQLLAFSI